MVCNYTYNYSTDGVVVYYYSTNQYYNLSNRERLNKMLFQNLVLLHDAKVKHVLVLFFRKGNITINLDER